MNSHQQQSGFMRRVPNSVGGRWAFMFVCLVGTIWGIVMGVAALEDRGDVGGELNRLRRPAVRRLMRWAS